MPAKDSIDLDIVIVNYKTMNLIQKLIDSLEEFKPVSTIRIVIVDNESEGEEVSLPPWCESVVLPIEENLGYAKACNLGASHWEDPAPYLLLLNSDTRFINNECIDKNIEMMREDPRIGVIGPRQVNSKNQVTHAGIVGPNNAPVHRAWLEKNVGQFRRVDECLTVMGAVVFINRLAWDEVTYDPIFRTLYPDAKGAFPEHFLYYEETAFCYAMPRFDYKVIYNGETEMIHEWNQSISKFPTEKYQWVKESREAFHKLMDAWEIER